jgi:hypothetical protein
MHKGVTEMARLVLVFGFILSLPQVYAKVAVDPRQWAAQQQSPYCVDKADGLPPKPENALADVFADTSEFVLTMPFCPEGGSCDPGYLYFPYEKTQVWRETLTDGSVQDSLTQPGISAPFTWTERGGVVTFINPEYKDLGTPRPLEHVLRRCP